ncbi:uncharacterized protein VDAG_04130 [Verticillium dahliae VdLs.17]|uniref:Uncharacterized protein n=1 Tax=Verticillium dahliae (strain VdLs.17 / ATCC MYA-4575 / FGSC 10137) TaxID=498257 RepID=G2X2T6_VERDV|nr:uncharacterized protein VDAG_04130 [Verticillium dahliae VdLs.17]EGY22692.1 hypothetical protein VDAG_04130 [Verticillium dahliae VdLs.17]
MASGPPSSASLMLDYIPTCSAAGECEMQSKMPNVAVRPGPVREKCQID